MPRVSTGPCYYDSKKGWFATIGGDQIRLITGPKKETQQEARERYDAEIAARKVETAGDRSTIWAVLNAYLHHAQNRVKNEDLSAGTLRMQLGVIKPFSDRCGSKLVRELRPQHITDFVAEMRQPRLNEKLKRYVKWGDGTVKLAENVLKTAFIWAVDEAGLISKNPLDRKGKRKQKTRRRRPSKSRPAIFDNEHQLLLEQAKRRTKKDFLCLLMLLEGTGARPAEMYMATAQEWREDTRALVAKAIPENRGRCKLNYQGEDRTIYIPGPLVPVVQELMAKYPTGPIFRTEWGKPWKNSTLCARFKSIKTAANRAAAKKNLPPIRKEVTAYSYRHAFVTRWVERGLPLWRLCELLQTSEAMVRKHYSHLFEKTELLRESLDGFYLDRGEPPANPPRVGPEQA